MQKLRELRMNVSMGDAWRVVRGGQLRWWPRALAIGLLLMMVTVSISSPAVSDASTSGWTDGRGRHVGVGNGLVLDEFYNQGATATWRQKWLGALDPAVVSGNTPGGVNTLLWCIEAGASITTSYSYSWSTDSNVRARYLMWLAANTWTSPDGRAAVQYLLYADAYPSLGSNNTGSTGDYESRIWNHTDFTSGAKAYANLFRSLSTTQMHNTAARLDADSHGGVPSQGDLDGIGIQDAWGNYVPGLSYTITINGDAVFDSTGTHTVTGVTGGALINDAHPWTATGSDTVDFTITYANANVGTTVFVGAGSGAQDMVAGGGFRSLESSDPTVDVWDMFQPAGDTQVPSATVAAGDPLVDVFTPAAINGTTWGIDGGAYVPVTYDWALYDAGTVIPGAPSATVPADWTLLEQIQVVATGGPGVPITSTFTSTAEAGHAYVFVVSFANANQPVATQGWFVADWSDQAGLADEVIVAPVTPSATSVASREVRGSASVILDEVTFTGFPADHGTFTGMGPFGADAATVQQRLWFFPAAAGLDVTDANTATAELMCDLTVPATNGTHQVDDTCATAKTDAWGQLVAGTYAWTSTFAGDTRAAAFATSVTDTAEQVTITNDPLAVSTVARQAVSSSMSGGSALTVWDGAAVTGYVPVGSTMEFALYAFTSRTAPVCDASTLITTLDLDGTFAGAGGYSSERYDLLVPATATGLGFVATVKASDGTVLHEGVCGDASETIAIARADDTDDDSTRDLARTGADRSWVTEASLGALAVLIGAALIVVAAWARRRKEG